MITARELHSAARQAFEQAYAPYSHFKVGAALLSDNNQIYSGCNVENISYPCGTCAEAGAIAAMVAGGGKRIKEIVIISDAKQLISPCGACLQRIAEFADRESLIHLSDLADIRRTLTLADLLPLNFSAEELKK